MNGVRYPTLRYVENPRERERSRVSDHYDREGKLMTEAEWLAAFSDTDRHVAKDTFSVQGAEVTVSTVWLGLDHSWGGGPPLIFETLVFDGVLDGEMERYTTEQEAREGHAEMVGRVTKAELARSGASFMGRNFMRLKRALAGE